jgi:nitrogen regulatory protein P-II 1
MKRIEAVITPRTLDTFKAAARRLGISEFELVEVYRLGSNATEGGKGIYQGCEYRTDLSPRLRVEFVMFDDEVQATVHRLLEFVHPESISVFRLDQEVRTISSAHAQLKNSLPSDQRMTTPGVTSSAHVPSLASGHNGKYHPVTAIRSAPIRH